MKSVTGRIKEIKQPRGGYVNPSEFEMIEFEDDILLCKAENVHSSVVGMVVDYIIKFNIKKYEKTYLHFI